MTIYRITYDTHIEATNAAQAEEILMENNSVCEESYFTSIADAQARFEELKAQLGKPHDLGWNAGRHLYWFEGVCMETAENCDTPEEDETLRDAFLTATTWSDDIAIGKEA